MTHENCTVGAVQSQDDGWGFVIINELRVPLVAFTYPSKTYAEVAHNLMVDALKKATVNHLWLAYRGGGLRL
jgi:hypothetical protein